MTDMFAVQSTEQPNFQFSLGSLLRFVTACSVLSAAASAIMAHPDVLHFVAVVLMIAVMLLVATVLIWAPILVLSFALYRFTRWTFGADRQQGHDVAR